MPPEAEAGAASTRAGAHPSEPALIPPLRFACVDRGVYRGAYPKPLFADFMARLELRTLVSVTPEPVAPLALAGVTYVHVASAAEQQKSKKKRPVPVSHAVAAQALAVIADPAAQPVYVHCLNGQQVTSLVIACLRVSQGWSVRSAMAEFERYADPDRRDVLFVESFSDNLVGPAQSCTATSI